MSEPRAYQSGAPYCAPFLGRLLALVSNRWKTNHE